MQPTPKRPRNSWVVWEEDGKYPNLIIELLSSSTANIDRTLKKELYQNQFRTPEYFWFSPDTLEFKGFRLNGQQYQEITPNAQGWRWSEVLQLYLGVGEAQLRYFTIEGTKVPTPEEAASQAIQQAQQAESRLKQEQARAERLAAQLRKLGIEPE